MTCAIDSHTEDYTLNSKETYCIGLCMEVIWVAEILQRWHDLIKWRHPRLACDSDTMPAY